MSSGYRVAHNSGELGDMGDGVSDADWDQGAQSAGGVSRRAQLIVFGAAALVILAAAVWGLSSVFGGRGPNLASQAAAPSSAPAPTSPTPSPSPSPAFVDPAQAADVAIDFLRAWEANDYEAMQALAADQTDDVAGAYSGMAERLAITDVVVTPGTLDPVTSVLPYDVTVTLDGAGPASWSSAVTVTPQARVAWSAATVYPGLLPGQWLDRVPVPSRGDIVDRSGASVSADPDLTANLIGDVGPDGVGTSGLQRAYEDVLAGPPGTALAVTNPVTAEVITTIEQWPGAPVAPLVTTLDLRVQRAATAALAGAAGRAALVAVDTGSGDVLAIANNPVEGLPAALAGEYPPGSTFKIVTASAALRAGFAPGSAVDCPASLSAGGRTFSNASSVVPGPTTLAGAFAVSCNTAFIEVGRQVGTPALLAAGESFGFGFGPPLPVASVSGSVPEPDSDVVAAADAIGQGTVTASPLHMASVAAAVANGAWVQPHVVACGECDSRSISGAAGLRDMMRQVVTAGSGRAVAGVRGGPVHGKTGSAQVAGGGAHAWFVGWQGSVAFAVFVEFGGSGAESAAPLAAAFLTELAVG